jgi:hypothetical protein
MFMPHTIAHPVMAIALNRCFRGRLDKTGLIAGTVAPDLQSFFLLKAVDTDFGHSAEGLLLFGLPVSLLLCFVFNRFAADPVSLHLPESVGRIACKLRKRNSGGMYGFFLLAASIVLGMLSHLFLDSFTHEGGLLYPLMTAIVQPLAAGAESAVMELQVLLSVICLAIEAGYLAYCAHTQTMTEPLLTGSKAAKRGYWTAVMLCGAAAVFASIALHRPFSAMEWAAVMAVAPFSGAMFGMFLAPVVLPLQRRVRCTYHEAAQNL